MTFHDRLDADHRAALADYEALDLSDLRAVRARPVDDRPSPAAAAVASEDHMVPGPPGAPDLLVRVYRPAAATSGAALYWIHGGGMMFGSVAGGDTECREIAAANGCLVASPEYRLAPEHPHPAPVEDCYAGLVWLAAQSQTFGLDAARIAVGGGSAGGGLAAGTALLARDRSGPAVAFQLLIFPMLDDRALTPSSRAETDPRVWNREHNAVGWRSLLGQGVPGSPDVSPYAAPSRAGDLAGLPPAYIAVGDLDIYLDEDVDYALRLGRADVPCELHVYPGAFHGGAGGAPESDQGKRWVRDMNEALQVALDLRPGQARHSISA